MSCLSRPDWPQKQKISGPSEETGLAQGTAVAVQLILVLDLAP